MSKGVSQCHGGVLVLCQSFITTTCPLHINQDVDKQSDGGGLVALTIFKQQTPICMGLPV